MKLTALWRLWRDITTAFALEESCDGPVFSVEASSMHPTDGAGHVSEPFNVNATAGDLNTRVSGPLDGERSYSSGRSVPTVAT